MPHLHTCHLFLTSQAAASTKQQTIPRVGSERHWVVTIPAGGSQRKRVPSIKFYQFQFRCSKLESAPAKVQRWGTKDMEQKSLARGRFQAAIHTLLSRVLVRSATCAVCSKLKKIPSQVRVCRRLWNHPPTRPPRYNGARSGAERLPVTGQSRPCHGVSPELSLRHLGWHTTGGDGEIRAIFPARVGVRAALWHIPW